MSEITEAKKRDVDDDDVTKVNKLTLKKLKKEDIFTFGLDVMRADTPTSNGRIWSREWLAANAARFVGAPVTVGHVDANEVAAKVATIYEATFDGTWLRARAFIPLTDPAASAARKRIENGTWDKVSIEGIGAVEQQGTYERIVPSDDDRALAVAIVLKPGLETARVTESVPPLPAETPAREDSLTTFAQEALSDLRNEFIRAAGFALPGTDRPLLRKVAEQLDPYVLRDLTRAIDRASTARQQESAREARAAAETVSSAVDEALRRIRQTKGIE